MTMLLSLLVVWYGLFALQPYLVNGQYLVYSVECDTNEVRVDFDSGTTTPSGNVVPWIGIYRESSLTNLPNLPSVDQGNLLDWQYTCGGTSETVCSNPPTSGSVVLDLTTTASVRIILSNDDWTATAQTGVFSIQSECDDDEEAEEESRIEEPAQQPESNPVPQSDPEPESEPEPVVENESAEQQHQGCNPRTSERRRRPWRTMTCTQQEEFLQAVEQLRDAGLYEEFIDVHVEMNGQTHRTEEFLPWHRWYLWIFETTLREVTGNCDITIPYWDWERDAGNERNVDLFDGDKFGRFECGRGAGWRNPCNERTMGRSSGGAGGRSFATETELLRLITRDSFFEDFSFGLEGRPHSVVHWFVGGMMSDRRSPTDPVFWLHHAAVDRIWTMHQDYHDHDVDFANGNYLNRHYNGAQNQRLPFPRGTQVDYSFDGDGSNQYPTPREILDNVDLRVRYMDDNLAGLLERDDYTANTRLFEAGDNSGGGCGRRRQKDRRMFIGGLRGRGQGGKGGIVSNHYHHRPMDNNIDTSFHLDLENTGLSLSEDEVLQAADVPTFCQLPTPNFTLEKDRHRWESYCELLSDPNVEIQVNVTTASDLFEILAELDCEDIASESGEPNFDMDFFEFLKLNGWASIRTSNGDKEREAYACPRLHH